MIAGLRGKLVSSNYTEAIVDVNGILFSVMIPMSTFDTLPRPGEEVNLLTYMQVREDGISLFGFATQPERTLFNLLITVNGIGAKTAINILSSMNIANFCSAVANGDLKMLKKVNGVGPKSAERILVELRDKIDQVVPAAAFQKVTGDPAADKEVEDALKALGQLGYQGPKYQKIAMDVTQALPKEQRSSENIIRKVLQSLNS